MNVVYFLSVFPSLTETFIFREIRALRKAGFRCRIAQLRPLGGTPGAGGFEDLTVVRGIWKSPDLLLGTAYAVFTRPKMVLRCIGFLFRHTITDLRSFAKSWYVLLATMGIAYRLRREEMQHVRSHYLHTEALAAMFLSMLQRVPYSTTCHTVKVHFPIAMVMEIAKKAEFVVADTEQVRKFIISLGVSPNRVVVIRNGIDISGFAPRTAIPKVEVPTILAVGRLDEKKGLHVLIDACAVLKEERVKFRCLIVGDGEQREFLRAQVNQLKLTSEVEFLGNVPMDQLRSIYHRASLFVMSSIVASDGETDGLPTVLIEAMASGIPVVGTRTAAIPEIVQEGVTGLLAEPRCARDLARAIQKSLQDTELMSKFALRGRELVERDYDLDRNVSALASVIGQTSSCATNFHEESIATQ